MAPTALTHFLEPPSRRSSIPDHEGWCCSIRLLTSAAVVLSLFPAVSPATNSQQTLCPKSYTRAHFHTAARAATRDTTLTPAELKTVRKTIRCQRGGRRSRRIVRFHWKRYRSHWEARRQVAAITPYPGPNGTRWAIPWPVVACESHGSWGAYNSSGAAGPYQIMAMHGRPFPVRSAADRLRHHQIAAMLWRGGAGAGAWVCKG